MEMRAYHFEWSHEDLMKARGDGIITDDGEAWRYQFTGMDSLGKYDLWRRPPFEVAADGMALRDHFAGQALAGHLASLNPGSINKQDARHFAKTAYLVADAMLAARKGDAA